MPAIIIPGRVIGTRPPTFAGMNPASPQAQDLRVWVPLLNGRANYRGVFGTVAGSWTGSQRAMPGAGWGYDFDGSDDALTFPNVLGGSFGIPITCSAWVTPDNTTHTGYIVANNSGSQIYGAALYARGSALGGSFADIRHYATATRRSSAGSVLTTGVPLLLTATIPASVTYTDIKL